MTTTALDNSLVELTPRGLNVRQLLTTEQWVEIGQYLAAALFKQSQDYDTHVSAVKWAIGDWLNIEGHKGTMHRAATLTNLSKESCQRCADTAKRYTYEARIIGASWEMHAGCNPLSLLEAYTLLTKAVTGEWDHTRWHAVLNARLREQLKVTGVGVDETPPKPKMKIVVGMLCPQCQFTIKRKDFRKQRVLSK